MVVKRFAFFSEAVGHAALTGVAMSGILLGEPYPSPTAACSATACCSASCSATCQPAVAPDTLIEVFLSVSLALGASLLLVVFGEQDRHAILENVLFSSVLTREQRPLPRVCWRRSPCWCRAWPCRVQPHHLVAQPATGGGAPVAVKSLDYLFVALVTLVAMPALQSFARSWSEYCW
ncbi:metal ABC transporter permease [Pseudomonas aeruginosa]|nr:metal ABC transporter permease [Pseudomonas aeruginosa]